MMREIKVRGWHVEKQRMFSCEEMVRDQLTLLTDGRFINVHGDSTARSTIFPRDKFIPLRFTGLKDKKRTEEYPDGQKIYEGDIVRQHYVVAKYDDRGDETDAYEGDHIGEVRILPSKGVVLAFPSEKITGDGQGGSYDYTRKGYYKHVRSYRAEVIGNIYENGDMLKAVNND